MPLFLPFRAVVLAVLLSILLFADSAATEPFLRTNDVVALVGGEDMVAAFELGYIELGLNQLFPQHHLKVRSLAWEADTVYEQKRDLNYPALEQQLDQSGATVIIAQFGQAESFDGPDRTEEFANAYESLVRRLTANGKRRAIILAPTRFSRSPLALPFNIEAANARLKQYEDILLSRPYFNSGNNRLIVSRLSQSTHVSARGEEAGELSRDGCHLSGAGHRKLAMTLLSHRLFATDENLAALLDPTVRLPGVSEQLRELIVAKNRLWFHYYRPQNWAFLAGDRTNQPSSRDHIDRTKRWFPEELQQFLPLIEQKEREIAKLLAAEVKP